MHRLTVRAVVAALLFLLAGSGHFSVLLLGIGPVSAATVYHSDLWGKGGELWTPASRLPDFSYAGYHAGEKAIPTVPIKAKVTDFGAKGDGTTDDTAAFKRAIAATANGALYIPEGRYKITGLLEITKSNLVLRGAGAGKTVLYMARSLKEILGSIPYGDIALLSVQGEQQGQKLTNVTGTARRGERVLEVSSTAGITPGQMIRLRMHNPSSNSLGCYLYANLGCLNDERQKWYSGNIIDWAVEVAAVQGNKVTLVRPLRVDVRREWSPTLWSHLPTVREVGIEHLSIAFPNVQYAGHGKWTGYYGIYLNQVFDSWVRAVTIIDADRGIELSGGGHNTLTDITFKTQWRRPEANPTGDGTTGHYGVALFSLTQDNLVRESDFQTIFDHNMAHASFANGNVFAGITSQSARFDSHGGAPYENLYTDIVLTKTAQDLLKSGGNRADEPNGGMHTTLWNILATGGDFPSDYNSKNFPKLNLIGMCKWKTKKTPDREWVECFPGPVSPPNLYEAQWNRRRGVVQPPAEEEEHDSDQDGLSDTDEETIYGTSALDADTDGDGIRDGGEVAFWGADWDADPDHDGLINVLDADADNDGITDGVERQQGTDPGTPPPTDADRVNLWIEAEASAALRSPMVIANDAQASGGKYLWVPTDSGDFLTLSSAAGEAVYQFTVPTAGTYVIWGLTSTKGGNSFFASVDNGSYLLWSVPNTNGAWDWSALANHPSTSAARFALGAGTHSLRLKQREDGTRIDRLLITNDLASTPRDTATPPPSGSALLWLEAEQSQSLRSPMVIASNSQVSGGKYIWVPSGQGDLWNASSTGGEARYQFTTSTTDTYVVWGRVSADGGNSFFVSINNEPYLLWNFPNEGQGTWAWNVIAERGSPTATYFELPGGTHTLSIKQREDGSRLDRLLITNDLTYIPR